MKIILYVRPGDDPNAVAEQAKKIIESNTGKMCNVRVTGNIMGQNNPMMEASLGY